MCCQILNGEEIVGEKKTWCSQQFYLKMISINEMKYNIRKFFIFYFYNNINGLSNIITLIIFRQLLIMVNFIGA